MGKVLYVRGFNDDLHQKLTEQSKKEGVPASSILEEAYQDWLKNRKGIPSVHFLVLYSEKQSLNYFLQKAREMIGEDWVKVCAGPESNTGVEYLKKRGWIDANLPEYSQGMKKPESYTSQVFDNIRKITAGKQACFMGFMTADVSQRHSLQMANEVERTYNTKRIGGVVFCPYDMTQLKNYSLKDLLELFGEHDKSFIVKENEIFEINVNKTNFAKLFLR